MICLRAIPVILAFIPIFLFSQSKIILHNEYELLLLNGEQNKQYNFHPSIRSYEGSKINQFDSLSQRLNYKTKNIIVQEAINFSNLDSGQKHLSIGMIPLVNFGYGSGTSNDSLDQSASTGLGIEFVFMAGDKFTAQFDYMYSSNTYADYVTDYVDERAVVPGMGAHYKRYDRYYNKYYSGYLNYRATDFLTLEAGRGKHFIGNGYRSLLLSDNSNAYPYFKIELDYWKLKYQVLYSSLNSVDTSGGFGISGLGNKYSTSGFLSMNIGRNVNVGLFQSVIWASDAEGERGFDVNYLNPVIFLRPVEYSLGSPDNYLLGTDLRYTFFKSYSLYGQVILDEFLLKEFRENKGWWGNKFGFQAGLKGFDLFKVPGLGLLAEVNWLRPYTYSHSDVVQNYGHNNENLAHTLGANFAEVIGRISYTRKRWLFQVHSVLSKKGEDPDQDQDVNFGGDIFKSNSTRESEDNNTTGQGISIDRLFIQFKLANLIIPRMRLMVEAFYILRMEDVASSAYGQAHSNTSSMVGISLKTALFNQYLDF